MINTSLDPVYWRSKLLQSGRVQIRNYLQTAAATRLHACLDQEVPWTLALRDADGARTLDADAYAALSSSARRMLFREIAERAASGEYRFSTTLT